MLQERLRTKKPVIGVCLGAQLLAAAAGANVYKGAAGFEVGFGELKRAPGAEAHPWGRRLPETFPVLHWHGDTFTLPEGAALLASTERYPHQICALGRHALGLQCHLEVAAADLPGFVGGNAEDLRPGTGVTRESILAQGAEMDARIEPVFQGLWRGIVAAVGGS
jgi:GMP synthase (glutamine-hydrolysing)